MTPEGRARRDGGGVPADPIVVVAYDSSWPRQFERLRDRASRALHDLVVTIEHIGSTAVPGLAAKPVIDLNVLLRSEDDLPRAIERLGSLGYAHEGERGIPGRHAFRWPEGEARHHLYVCLESGEEHKRQVLFRDYLRSHEGTAVAYGELKRRLAIKFRNDRDGYVAAKSEFIEGVLQGAQNGR